MPSCQVWFLVHPHQTPLSEPKKLRPKKHFLESNLVYYRFKIKVVMTILITSGKEFFSYYYIFSGLMKLIVHTWHLAIAACVRIHGADVVRVGAASPVSILIKMAIKNLDLQSIVLSRDLHRRSNSFKMILHCPCRSPHRSSHWDTSARSRSRPWPSGRGWPGAPSWPPCSSWSSWPSWSGGCGTPWCWWWRRGPAGSELGKEQNLNLWQNIYWKSAHQSSLPLLM